VGALAADPRPAKGSCGGLGRLPATQPSGLTAPAKEMAARRDVPSVETGRPNWSSQRGVAPTTPDAPAITIGSIALNSRDVVRCDIGTFNGRAVFHLRKWYWDGAETKPTPKGLSVALVHLPAIAALVNEALARAIADGLLPNDEGAPR
jgi:hypothetical protein